jgi:hypothetical protein
MSWIIARILRTSAASMASLAGSRSVRRSSMKNFLEISAGQGGGGINNIIEP